MPTRIQQYVTATNGQWLKRVEMSLMLHAHYRVQNREPDGELAVLGAKVLADSIAYAARISKAVCVLPGDVQQGIDASFAAEPPDESGGHVADAALDSAIEVVFPQFLRS